MTGCDQPLYASVLECGVAETRTTIHQKRASERPPVKLLEHRRDTPDCAIERTPLTCAIGGASRLSAHVHIEPQLLSSTPEAVGRSRPLSQYLEPTRLAHRWKSGGLPGSRQGHSCYGLRRIHRRSSFPEYRGSSVTRWTPKRPARAVESPAKTSAGRLRVSRSSALHMCYIAPIPTLQYFLANRIP